MTSTNGAHVVFAGGKVCGNAFWPLHPEAGGALAEAHDAPPLALSPVAVVRLGPFGADREKVLCVHETCTVSECNVKWGG